MELKPQTKLCKGCGNILPLTGFYKKSGMKDGLAGKCKECIKSGVAINYRANIDHYKEYGRSANRRVSRAIWADKNPIKIRAKQAVMGAVRAGKLCAAKRCSNCDKQRKTHGHHDDYSQPLVVRWLCQHCHMGWHQVNGEGING